MYAFGSGVLIGTRNDVPNSTPINFGLVQGVTIDEAATVKELYGQNQRPVAIGRGTIKTHGKASVARISGLALASLFYGYTPVAGQLATAFGEAGSGPIPASPFQLTVTNTATFVDDLGVINATTGLPFTKVGSAPAAGQYSVSASGQYTFAAADTGKTVLFSYTYTIPATGQKFTVKNELLGFTPTFSAQFYTTYQGQSVSVKINNATSSKFSFATKLEDFTIPDFEFSCFADAAGNIMTWSFSEAS